MAMESSTIKMWSSYDWSSLQSELSKEFSWKDWNETSLGKFIKGTRKATRKSQWQRQQGNSSKHWVRWSALWNSQKTENYSGSEARSMFPGTQTYEDEWSPCVMTRRLLSTLDTGKHWNWSLGTTGGHRCLGTLDSMSAPMTSVLGQNR